MQARAADTFGGSCRGVREVGRGEGVLCVEAARCMELRSSLAAGGGGRFKNRSEEELQISG